MLLLAIWKDRNVDEWNQVWRKEEIKNVWHPNLRWKIQPLGSWQTLSIVRQEQHGRNRLRFKLWVMAFNLLRALLILKLQVRQGRLHGEGAVVVILGAPDDRWEQTIGTDEHLKIYNTAGHQQTGQVISTQNTQRNVHLLCSHLAQKNDRLSVFVKKFSAQR